MRTRLTNRSIHARVAIQSHCPATRRYPVGELPLKHLPGQIQSPKLPYFLYLLPARRISAKPSIKPGIRAHKRQPGTYSASWHRAGANIKLAVPAGAKSPFTGGYPPDGARPLPLMLLPMLLTKYLRFPLGLRLMAETYSNSSLAIGMRCSRIR
jgi:hypothetical protein